MNRKEGFVVALLLIGVFFASAPAMATVPGSPSPTPTPQVTSVDIDILNVAPSLTYLQGNLGPVSTGISVSINEPTGSPGNLTAAFSFAPATGFSHMNSALLTVVYFGGTGGYTGFGVEINGQSSIPVRVTTIQNTALATLSPGDLRVGANTINIGLVPVTPNAAASTFIYQARMTIEYTFLA
jgi:hypothetical protein